MSEMMAGKEYKINHRRKGTFTAVCLDPGQEESPFATFIIATGEARYLTEEDRGSGRQITIRKSLCTFKESPCEKNNPTP